MKLLKFSKNLFGIFSEDLGIDLGTANTLVCVKNKGVVLNEPSVVSINTKTKSIIAVGEKAKKMIGRTPEAYEAIKPLKNGVIADYEITEKMLSEFYSRVKKRNFFNSPRVVICVPAGVSQVERRAVIDVTLDAGAREAYLIEEPMAAAIGVGINIFDPEGSLIVDVGGGTTEIAIISLGGIVRSSSLKVAGDKIDVAIMEYVRQRNDLLIGEKTAEDIKINIATALVNDEEITYEISGRNILNGLPRNVTISSIEIQEAIAPLIVKIVEEIKLVLEKTPPELSADIKRKGVILTGGGAKIRGLDQKIAESIDLTVEVSENPLNCVVNGIEVLLQNFQEYKNVLISPDKDY